MFFRERSYVHAPMPTGGHVSSQSLRGRRYTLKSFTAAAAILAATAGATMAAEGSPPEPRASTEQSSSEALAKKLLAMEERIRKLEAQLKQKQAAAPTWSPNPSPVNPPPTNSAEASTVATNAKGALAAAVSQPAAPKSGDKRIRGVLAS